jgi:hypothetical protein
MCDPLVGGLIAGAASLAAGASQQSANEDLANKQNQANADWVAYQTRIHQQQAAAEDLARGKAESARQDTLGKVTAPAQEATQATEQERLNTLYNAPQGTKNPADTDPSSLALSGESTGPQNASFTSSLTSQVNAATAAARQRISALATAGSYGGSFGGLGTVVPQTFAQGGNQIQLQNDIRQGNLKTYGVEQQVQPLQYTMGGTGNMMGSIATSLGGLAGKGISTGLTSAWSSGA